MADGVAVPGRDSFIAADDEVGGGRKNGYGERFISRGKPKGVGRGGRRRPRSPWFSSNGNGGGRRGGGAGVDRSLLFAWSFSR